MKTKPLDQEQVTDAIETLHHERRQLTARCRALGLKIEAFTYTDPTDLILCHEQLEAHVSNLRRLSSGTGAQPETGSVPPSSAGPARASTTQLSDNAGKPTATERCRAANFRQQNQAAGVNPSGAGSDCQPSKVVARKLTATEKVFNAEGVASLDELRAKKKLERDLGENSK